MKTLFLVVICAIFNQITIAQNTADSKPAYVRLPAVPPFNVLSAADSLLITKDDLKKKKPLVIMIFSPDCDHCQLATENLLKNIDLYKNAQILLVSSLSYASVKEFYQTYKLYNYPNIKVGYDKGRFLSSFYEVKSFPSIFLYDKKGKFKADFSDHPLFEQIAEQL